MSMQGCTPLNNVRYIMRSANPRFPKACLTLPNDPKLHTQAAGKFSFLPLVTSILVDNHILMFKILVLVSDCSKISKPDSVSLHWIEMILILHGSKVWRLNAFSILQWLFTKSGVGTKPSWTTQYLQKGFFLIGTKSMGIAGVDWPDSDAATRFKLWQVNPVDVFKTFGCR